MSGEYLEVCSWAIRKRNYRSKNFVPNHTWEERTMSISSWRCVLYLVNQGPQTKGVYTQLSCIYTLLGCSWICPGTSLHEAFVFTCIVNTRSEFLGNSSLAHLSPPPAVGAELPWQCVAPHPALSVCKWCHGQCSGTPLLFWQSAGNLDSDFLKKTENIQIVSVEHIP